MFALPISDNAAIAVDDADEDTWWIHVVDFDARTIESFSVDGVGPVQSAHYDAGRGLLWTVVGGQIFAVQRSKEEVFDVDLPEDEEFFVYAMIGEGDSVYVGGEYSNLWRLALPELEWEALLRPEPKPARQDDVEEQSRQTREYARRYPPFYAGFRVLDDYVFCGALGALARIRGGSVETRTLGSSRLVSGRAEGDRFSLSADSPAGEIHLGNFEQGFELISSDPLRALHRTAMHEGRRYIGVAEHPPSDVHNLYVREAGELVPIETGCAREPAPMISLSATGEALWAIDAAGVFRLREGAWTLIDLDDLRRGEWPGP